MRQLYKECREVTGDHLTAFWLMFYVWSWGCVCRGHSQ